MGLFSGKKGLVLGVANDWSIAWAITRQLLDEGAEVGFTHLPGEKMERRVRKLAEPIGAKLITPCNVADDTDVARVFAEAGQTYGALDFVLHSIAYAPIEDLKVPFVMASREGFKTAMDISVYSLAIVARHAAEVMPAGGSIATLTYFGGERVVSGYNLMGVCKAALDASVRYLAYDLGPKKIRVNALSAGPVKTLAASAVGESDKLAGLYEAVAPMGRNIDRVEVGKAGMFLLSDLASGITGEIMHVDCGYNIMGSPGRAIEAAKAGEGLTRVGIGLVGRDNHYLIRLRPPLPGSPMPGVWEFPGGKCEPGESPEAATARECREESGLAIVVLGRRRVTSHCYPHGLVELHYFDCVPADPAAEPDDASGFRWVAGRDLPAHHFPEANGPVLEELARGVTPAGGGDR